MKKYFAVSFKYSEDVYCSNLAHAETAEAVAAHYSKYERVGIREAEAYELDEAKRKGKPIVEIETPVVAITEEPKEEENENVEYCKDICLELETYYNGEVTGEDGEPLSLYDYFADVLDYEFICDSRKEYRACRVYVALGGPTVWIDTERGTVELRWGTEQAAFPLRPEVREEIDQYFEELFYSL